MDILNNWIDQFSREVNEARHAEVKERTEMYLKRSLSQEHFVDIIRTRMSLNVYKSRNIGEENYELLIDGHLLATWSSKITIELVDGKIKITTV